MVDIRRSENSQVDQVGSAPTFAIVSSVSSTILAANPARTGLILTNISGDEISLAFGSNAAVIDTGIVIYRQGGTFVMDSSTYTTQAIQAISSNNRRICIQEFT